MREGDRYELSNGHAIYRALADKRQAGIKLLGAMVLGADPDVEWAGINAGFTPEAGELRGSDIAVGAVADPPGRAGWIPGAPPLAVEYAGPGQDEAELKAKIGELLAAGTRWIWVVRLTGPHRMETHTADGPVRVAGIGDPLEAPGVLRNPVPMEALFDPRAADRIALRNLLQREGCESLEAVREEGKAEGIAEGKVEGEAQKYRPRRAAFFSALETAPWRGRLDSRPQGRAPNTIPLVTPKEYWRQRNTRWLVPKLRLETRRESRF